GLSFDTLLADKAFDSNWIVEERNARGTTICISQRPQRKEPLAIDEVMYKSRHLVENFFCDLEDFRRIALRTDKTDLSFEAIVNACAALLNSK
ncbi:IS5/IS1182 family transposase, partial [Roseobacter sp. WL0113]|nr:IS5/IS1182 family transposase [Roseobacter sp. WL0113]